MVVAQKENCRSMEQDRKPRNEPTHLWLINLRQKEATREARLYSGGKAVSSTNGAGKTGQLHVKKRN